MDALIDEGELCTNDIILAELLPSINHRNENELKSLLLAVPRLQTWIDRGELVALQTENLRQGINKVGIPDLMIVQNAMQNSVPLFSCDKHFVLMEKIFPITLFVQS